MTTEGRFCPTCGTKRTGFFRFCSKCGFDFDELVGATPAVAPIAPGQVELAPSTPTAPAPVATPPPAPIPAAPEPSILDTVTTVRPEAVVPQRPKSRERTIVRVAIVALAGLLGLSAVANAIGQRDGSSAEPSTAIGSPLVGEVPGSGSASGSPAAPSFAPTGPTRFAIVMSVTDGDTIRVDIDGEEYPLRYIGIDAPEPDATDPTTKGWADAATAANRELVDGREVFLESDVSDQDQFGRLLRNVWYIGSDGEYVLVNLELVRRGFAQAKTFPPDEKYASLLTQAQESARTAALGVWAPAEPAISPSTGSSPATIGATPLPLVDGGGQAGSDCHPSYTPCLPIVGDLDCADVRSMGAAPVRVKGPDDYRLDREGDGIGCE
jgi:micrococcal nuclease